MTSITDRSSVTGQYEILDIFMSLDFFFVLTRHSDDREKTETAEESSLEVLDET